MTYLYLYITSAFHGYKNEEIYRSKKYVKMGKNNKTAPNMVIIHS